MVSFKDLMDFSATGLKEKARQNDKDIQNVVFKDENAKDRHSSKTKSKKKYEAMKDKPKKMDIKDMNDVKVKTTTPGLKRKMFKPPTKQSIVDDTVVPSKSKFFKVFESPIKSSAINVDTPSMESTMRSVDLNTVDQVSSTSPSRETVKMLNTLKKYKQLCVVKKSTPLLSPSEEAPSLTTQSESFDNLSVSIATEVSAVDCIRDNSNNNVSVETVNDNTCTSRESFDLDNILSQKSLSLREDLIQGNEQDDKKSLGGSDNDNSPEKHEVEVESANLTVDISEEHEVAEEIFNEDSRHGHFQCGGCNKIYKYLANFEKHVKTGACGTVHKCATCEDKVSFKTLKTLKQHVMRKHLKPVFKCAHCDKIYPSEKAVNKHIEFHHKTLKCDSCDSVLANANSLRSHKFKFHSKNRKSETNMTAQGAKVDSSFMLDCTYCEMKFNDKKTLDAHNEIHMSNRKGQNCENFITLTSDITDVLREMPQPTFDFTGEHDVLNVSRVLEFHEF